MPTLWETRALIESGWPDALTVSPEDLATLRAEERATKRKMWATIIALPLVVVQCVAVAGSLLSPRLAESRADESYERTRSTPRAPSASSLSGATRGLPTLFAIDRELELQLRPQQPYGAKHLPKPVRDYSGLDLLHEQRLQGP